MPGICGLIGKPSMPDGSGLLTEMLQRMRHHPWYLQQSYHDAASGLALGRMTLGFVNKAEQPAFNEGRTILAMMEGEVYDYDEQRRSLTAAGHQFASDSHAELLLHGYESQGPAFFRGLHGTFVAALWDTRARRLFLTNDHFGMKPLYYVQLPGRLVFASELKALLVDPDVPRQSSRRGVAQFFTFGQLLGDDTLLEAVRYLPAAAWLTYDPGEDRLTLERYGRLEAGAAQRDVKESELLDRLDAAFSRAVEQRTTGPNPLGLSLSGGLDARTILAVMDPARTPVTTVTLGMDGSMDLRSSRQMAELMGCPHHNYVLSGQFLADFEQHLRRLVYLTDGHFQSQCITLPTLPLYRELGIEVLLRGHAGELLHMDKAYSYSLGQDAFAIADEAGLEVWLWRHLPAFVSTAGCGPLFAGPRQDEMETLARDSLRDCLRESAGIEPILHRIWHLFITQRLRRETALSLVEFGSVVETRLPYLDSDLVELLLAAPPQLKVGDTIQAHILRRHRPAFLDVINTNTGARLGAGRLERLWARARLKVFAKLGVRGYQPYERLGLWLRRELRPLVQKLLLSDVCLGRGIFNPQTVRAVVENHLNGRQNHTFLLLNLMIFETGQRDLFDAAASGTPESVAARAD
jgi:asparagine synthase (glutamine-hydrolysing)